MINALLSNPAGSLVILLLAATALYAFFGNKKSSPTVAEAPVVVAHENVTPAPQNNDEVVAAIMAAVTLCMGNSNFKIKSISPLVVRPLVSSYGDSPWTIAGIAENNRR